MFNQLPAPLDGAGLDQARRPIVSGYDVYPDVLYSTIQFPAAGQAVSVPLKFFQGAESVPSDTSLTNVPQGTLPGGQKFHARKLFIKPLVEVFVAGVGVLDNSGTVRDFDRVFGGGSRGQWTYVQTSIQKTRGPFPLDAIGEQGGVIAEFGGNDVPAAGNNGVYQHPRLPIIGGWPLDLIIYETETFPFNLTWGLQQTVSAAFLIQLRLYGWRYIKTG
jgi:hypothetical protein